MAGFRDFCGGSLWNASISWDTQQPDFTPCLESTLFAWLPAAFLILGLPFEVTTWQSSIDRRIPISLLFMTKLLLSLGMAACTVTELLLVKEHTSITDSQYVGPGVEGIAYLFSALLQVMALKNGVITSGPQFVFWLVDSVCRAFTFRTVINVYIDTEFPSEGELRDRFILALAHLIGSLCLLLLSTWADQTTNEDYLQSRKPCPEYNSSFFNRLIFSWATPLMWRGWRQPLVPEDLWDISPSLASKNLVPKFERFHKEQIAKKNGGQGNKSLGKETITSSSVKKEQVSVLPALVKAYGGSFAIGSVLKLCCDLLNIASPRIMKLMISFVESWNNPGDGSVEVVPEEHWKGYFYAALLFCVVSLQSVLMSQYFRHMFIIGVKVRTTLISSLYKKSLKISAAAKKESTMGEVVNLMSVDVQRFMDLLPYANILWSALLQIGLCTYFIYEELGWPAFVGVAILFLSMPLNGVLATLMRKLTLKQMKFKDQRIKLMNEILGGMKVLKLYAWEPSFIGQVLSIRNQEIKVMKTSAYYRAFMSFFWTTAPFMVGLGAFATYILIDGGQVLTAQQAFVTLSYLNIMRMPLAIFPMMVAFMVQAKVSLDRVNKFMNNEELSEEAVEHKTEEGEAISISGGHFKWGPEEPSVLQDINMSVAQGSLTAVVGSVGSGKSSLISAMLGELHKESGRVATSGRVAYVPQQAWIQNCTLKDNIIFNQPGDEERYKQAVESCALTTDLEILPAGDQTEIGEKGINLSGGQKQRVSMARAVYSQADVFLLDDPLSAVDSHVGKHMFDKVIGPRGVMANKTRVLVTHGVTFLPQTDHIIVLKNGRISEQGSYQQLVQQKGQFADFLAEYMAEGVEEEETEEVTIDKEKPQKQISQQISVKEVKEVKETKKNTGTTLIEKENAETGSVKLGVYLYYMRAVGMAGCLAAILGQVISSATQIMVSYWMTWWTSNRFGDANDPEYRKMYLGVYGGIGLLQSVVVMSYSAIIAFSTLNASKQLHKKMLTRVMMSPMSFFDTTPLGRIVNRFGKDVDVCDNTLPGSLQSWISTLAQFLGTIITIMTVIPLFILVILPVAVIFFFIQNFYVSTSRQLKRLESVSRSPIYSHFGESLQGSSVIRAFGMENDFITQSQTLVDMNQVCYFPSIIANRWLAIRLELLGNLVTVGAALFIIVNPNVVTPAQVGLVITYSLNVTQVLNWLVRQTAEVETNIVAVERLKEYSMLGLEAPWVFPDTRPEQAWPAEGEVEFLNYGLRYREDTPLVVEDISVTVAGGQKVGIVGRTGAGKSTLTVALFRLVESALGSIKIDKKDIANIGLHDLRNKLTIIPQDPVLFSGSLRMNLDPFSKFPDSDLWSALEKAHLATYVTGTEAGLEHPVAEGGENLSVGQRQLVCLARALLRKTKVLVLDEATAAVDLETDDLIQATIRKEFADSTVLTIAHRLNTIMDYDRIMVLDKGRLVEFDTPEQLLDNQASIFHGMAVDAGLAEARTDTRM